MIERLVSTYDRLVLRHPWWVLLLVALTVAGFASQLGKIKLDASADSLMLQGDPSLEFYREISAEYSSEDFLLLTWQPPGPLLGDESLQPLRRMADELRLLDGVSSVVTVWDVPLLESPMVTLSDITSPDPLPSLDKPGIDKDLVLRELTTSPIYADLLVSRDGQLTAVQINLERDDRYYDLLTTRDGLRIKRDDQGLSAAEAGQLARGREAVQGPHGTDAGGPGRAGGKRSADRRQVPLPRRYLCRRGAHDRRRHGQLYRQ